MTYEPPPKRVCYYSDYETPLDEYGLHKIMWESWEYRDLVVRFALVQLYRETIDSAWEHVYRADVKYGEVHEHFHQRGEPYVDARYVTVEVIPDHGWETVDRNFASMSEDLFTKANERLERWARGR